MGEKNQEYPAALCWMLLLGFTYELARRVHSATVNVHAMCRGLVPETVAMSTKGFSRWMMRVIMPHMPFATRLLDAVESICSTPLDFALEKTTGDMWLAKQPFAASPQSHSLDDAIRFWTWAASTTKTEPWLSV